MIKYILFILSICPLFSFGQSIAKANLVGEWKVMKVWMPPTDSKNESPAIKEVERKRNVSLMELFGETILRLNVTDTFIWKANDESYSVVDKYWTYDSNTNEIIVCDWENIKTLKPETIRFEVLLSKDGSLFLIGNGVHIELAKMK